MLLIYTPEDGDRQEFVFRPGKLLSPESEAIEKVGDYAWSDWDEFSQRFMAGNLRARRAALWIMLKRQQPTLRFVELVVRVDEIDVDLEEDERQRIRDAVETSGDMSDEDRAQALALLEEEKADAIIDRYAAELGDEPEGKERDDADSTSST